MLSTWEDGIAVIVAGGLCVAAIVVSVVVDLVYKNKKSSGRGYECGFDNDYKILFCDIKQPMISYFLVFELIVTIILICSLYLISDFISVHKVSLLLLLFITFIGMFYYSKNHSDYQ
ncbi:MAG: hypothetical protein LBG13_00920 [Holosporales bacterium]|jgi:hypothetical protein|nr:hypothetical protein [Holosporales bacterium]